MNGQRRFSQDDLVLFAMQLLSKEETKEISAWLERSEEGRRELAEAQGDLSIYAQSVDVHSPPSLTRDRLLKQVAKEKKAVPVGRGTSAKERSGKIALVSDEGPRTVAKAAIEAPISEDDRIPEDTGLSLVGAGRGRAIFGNGGSLTEDDLPQQSTAMKIFPWAVAAGMSLFAGTLYQQRDALRQSVTTQTTRLDHVTADAETARQVLDTLTDSTAMHVTLAKGPGVTVPQGHATYLAEKGALIFIATSLEPLPPLKTYELWLIPAAEEHDPIPAGTFHPDEHGSASVILPALPKGVAAKAFGVTIEDKDGATTPTLPIILVGTQGQD